MEYLPAPYRGQHVVEGTLADLDRTLKSVTVVRRVKCSAFTFEQRVAVVQIEGLPNPIRLNADYELNVGGERRSIAKYLVRVIEPGDLIDFLLLPGRGQVVQFWIHIVYADAKGSATFSAKDDAQFAMRAKSGEKAERLVARDLQNRLGHNFPAERLESPGVFEIRYAGKKVRKPDLQCQTCGIRFEVKKRNYDDLLRVSHSTARPFSSENRPSDWHAFVFHDNSVHYISNISILREISAGKASFGSDRFDSWMELRKDRVPDEVPPACSPLLG